MACPGRSPVERRWLWWRWKAPQPHEFRLRRIEEFVYPKWQVWWTCIHCGITYDRILSEEELADEGLWDPVARRPVELGNGLGGESRGASA